MVWACVDTRPGAGRCGKNRSENISVLWHWYLGLVHVDIKWPPPQYKQITDSRYWRWTAHYYDFNTNHYRINSRNKQKVARSFSESGTSVRKRISAKNMFIIYSDYWCKTRLWLCNQISATTHQSIVLNKIKIIFEWIVLYLHYQYCHKNNQFLLLPHMLCIPYAKESLWVQGFELDRYRAHVLC